MHVFSERLQRLFNAHGKDHDHGNQKGHESGLANLAVKVLDGYEKEGDACDNHSCCLWHFCSRNGWQPYLRRESPI